MSHTIFLSWQADTPNECGRNFVEAALKRALKLLGDDTVVDPAIRDEGLDIDADTRGIAGSPPIVDTIFKKIDQAAVFLADLTFVATRLDATRKSPNPNVLVEHGWALKALTHSRVLGVMNTAYGQPTDENMPFDMKHLRRPITYHLPAGSPVEDKRRERERLVSALKAAIGTVLVSQEFTATLPKPAPPPRFVPAQTAHGAARFRSRGSELGIIDTGLYPPVGTAITLLEGPAMWLRVMPRFNPGRRWKVTELKKIATQDARALLPLGWSTFAGQNYIRAEDGFGFTSLWKEDSVTPAVAFAFDTGEIWTVNAFALAAPEVIPYVEPSFAESFSRFIKFLQVGLNISPPYQWIAGLEGTKGRGLEVVAPANHAAMFSPMGMCLSESIVATGTFDGNSEIHLALQPFFETIYDRCGVERPAQLDEALKLAVEQVS